MGLAVAVALARSGADVSIVARNEERLAAALEQIEVCYMFTHFTKSDDLMVSYIFLYRMPVRALTKNSIHTLIL